MCLCANVHVRTPPKISVMLLVKCTARSCPPPPARRWHARTHARTRAGTHTHAHARTHVRTHACVGNINATNVLHQKHGAALRPKTFLINRQPHRHSSVHSRNMRQVRIARNQPVSAVTNKAFCSLSVFDTLLEYLLRLPVRSARSLRKQKRGLNNITGVL